MDRLKKLELNRLVKEFGYVKSDYDYKSEVAHEADTEFIICVNKFLSEHLDIKELFDNKINSKIESAIKKNEENESKPIIPSNDQDNEIIDEIIKKDQISSDIKNPKIKHLYRVIVKMTHPDKVNDIRLNEIYIESTKHYDDNNLMEIYSICDKLFIEYELDESEGNSIKIEIDSLKRRIEFLQTTYTWKWNESDEKTKESILLSYIRSQIE